MTQFGEVLIPLAAMAMPIVLVPTIMAMRQASKKREYEHLERMKALETGQPIPGELNWAGAIVCAAVGAGVPIASFLFTFLATVNASNVPGEIWIAPVVTSFFALFSAAKLGTSIFQPAKPATGEQVGKPVYDPDAYETVGR